MRNMRNVLWQRDFDKGPWSCWTLKSSHAELLQGCSDACVQSKGVRANNVVCSLFDVTVTACCLTWVYADIVGRIFDRRKWLLRLVKNDNWNAQFKTAQQLWNKDIITMESKPSSSKAKHTFLDLTSPGNRTVSGELKNLSQKRQTFPLLSSFTRTDCRLMLLICRALQLWLTHALNSVNSIRGEKIHDKHWINAVGF